MSATAVVPVQPDLSPLVSLVLDAVHSDHTRRAYGRHLRLFLAWVSDSRLPFCRQTVQQYRAKLETAGASSSAINQALSSLKLLASEAMDNGLLDPVLESGIARIHGVRRLGRRAGNWLTRAQAQRLLDLPDVSTLKGKRDRVLLGLLLGCGLRRSEACALTVAHVQMREDRPCIVDLVGKHGRVRTLGMPWFAYNAIQEWLQAAGISEGAILRRVNRADRVEQRGLSASGIWVVVRRYAAKIGVKLLAPHDLRRSAARLAKRGGADLSQLQYALGHGSPTVTAAYIGADQDLQHSPFDLMGIGG